MIDLVENHENEYKLLWQRYTANKYLLFFISKLFHFVKLIMQKHFRDFSPQPHPFYDYVIFQRSLLYDLVPLFSFQLFLI